MGRWLSVGNIPLNPDEAAFPCGEVAYTYFSDSFKL
jgi:hypothetical protein